MEYMKVMLLNLIIIVCLLSIELLEQMLVIYFGGDFFYFCLNISVVIVYDILLSSFNQICCAFLYK